MDMRDPDGLRVANHLQCERTPDVTLPSQRRPTRTYQVAAISPAEASDYRGAEFYQPPDLVAVTALTTARLPVGVDTNRSPARTVTLPLDRCAKRPKPNLTIGADRISRKVGLVE